MRRAFSPDEAISSVEAFSLSNMSATSLNCLFVYIFIMEDPFPIPCRREVVSQPSKLCRKKYALLYQGEVVFLLP